MPGSGADRREARQLRIQAEDLPVCRDGAGRYGLVEALYRHRRVSLGTGNRGQTPAFHSLDRAMY